MTDITKYQNNLPSYLCSFSTVPTRVFAQVGSSVQLDTQHPVLEFDDLTWVFNRTNNVLKYYPEFKKAKQYPGYEGRVEFNEETYSLTLKNLQKTDSGLYEVRASGVEVRAVAEYRLSVLDPVEAPVRTHQLSNDTCTITLICRGHDYCINFSCCKETCEEKEVTSGGGITLSLSVSGSTIICNHSNPVSWKTDVLEMRRLKQLCADEGEGVNTDTHRHKHCL
ncbi:CD48 antigen-like [Colossoma macropomum]|uniref:CD48 antigen-like n=1 Tax=Colossoma macropomum TaxID=42526 RepID=UPI001863C37C|nr:CD48 antigen-like [Colossoma macropomum]